MIFSQNLVKSQNQNIPEDNSSFYALLMLGIASFFYGTSVGMNLSSFGFFLKSHNQSSLEISHILSFEMAGNIFVAPFVLILSTKFGIFRFMLFSSVLRGIALVIFGISDTPSLWEFSMFMFGVGGFGLYVALFQWVNFLSKDRNRAFYISVASVAFGSGIGSGPLIILYFDIQLGQITFIISVLICMLMLAPLKMIEYSSPSYLRQSKISVTKILHYAYVPMICALACEFIFFSISEFMPIYLMGQGKSHTDSYLLSSVFTYSGLILAIPVGLLMDRFGRIYMIMIFALAISASIQILPNIVNHEILLPVLFAIISTSINGIRIGGLAVLGDKFKSEDFLAANSTVQALSTIGGFSGVYTTGLAMDMLGDKGFIFSISSLFLTFLFLLVLSTRKKV
jgi:MFS family permease